MRPSLKRSTSAAALTLAFALPQQIWAQDGDADCAELIASYEAANGEGSAQGADPASAGDEATAACLAQTAGDETEAAPAEDAPADAAGSETDEAEATVAEDSSADAMVEDPAGDEAGAEAPPAEAAPQDTASEEQASEEAAADSDAAEEAASEARSTDETATEEAGPVEEAAPAEEPVEAETQSTGDAGAADAEATEAQQLEEALQAEEDAQSAAEATATGDAGIDDAAPAASEETAVGDTQPSTEDPQASDDAEAAGDDDAPDQEVTTEAEPSEEAEPATGEVATEEAESSETDAPAESETAIEVTQEDTEESTEAANTQMDPAAASADAETTEATDTETTVITEENSRSSDEEFSNSAAASSSRSEKSDDDDDGNDRWGDFAKIAAGVAGGVILNELLGQNDEVVENTGDRVVVQRQNGEYYVLKDDDTLLRRPGTELQTRSFSDGSTRTIATRDDGTEVITISAANGQVLRRTRVLSDGREIVLFDDTAEVEPVNLSDLPPPQRDVITIEDLEEESLRRALAGETAAEDRIGRTFSLAQVRNIRAVRALVPTIELENVTFDTGSSAIRPSEAEELAAIGRAMRDMIAKNPDEVFLIEGHTDAVGSASMNLALSDRRAESVALALTEYFDVPPENMVVQGYGESDLKIQTGIAERENRRAAVRRITPLLTASR